MKKIFITILFALISTEMLAKDFEKGMTAFQEDNFVTALEEWMPLAEQGNVRAQFYLGNMYEYGKGVLKDDAEAVRWYCLAAKQGNARAQSNLGVMYNNGTGVPKHAIFAHMWYTISSANGYERAASKRDSITIEMTQDDITEATRRARVCMASNYQDCN